MKERPDWNEYFLKMAMLVSERSTCPRMHCGCVIVNDKKIIATGYNGSHPKGEHCQDVGCIIENDHCTRTIHAEKNAISQATTHGVAIKGCTAYITATPCTVCANVLIKSGIKKVVVILEYKQSKAEELFKSNQITFEQVDMPNRQIEFFPENYSSAENL